LPYAYFAGPPDLQPTEPSSGVVGKAASTHDTISSGGISLGDF